MNRVTVLTGGSTPERDVALAGAAQVVAALRGRGFQVTVVDTVSGALGPADEARLLQPSVGREPPDADLLGVLAERELGHELAGLPAIRDADVVFLVLHGLQGEGGQIQALLESADVAYTGSDPLGSAVAMDKDIAKRLFRDRGIPTPAWAVWPASEAELRTLGVPVVVKPSRVGSSVGLSIVGHASEIPLAVAAARAYDEQVLIERCLEGREFTVGVLAGEPLAVGEIIPSHEVFDYECKYTPGLTEEVFPADVPAALADRMRTLAQAAHAALKLRDFSRVDFRLDADGEPSCLEVNTLPGLTATSLLPQSAAALGIAFDELCERICRMALQRAETGNKVEARGR